MAFNRYPVGGGISGYDPSNGTFYGLPGQPTLGDIQGTPTGGDDWFAQNAPQASSPMPTSPQAGAAGMADGSLTTPWTQQFQYDPSKISSDPSYQFQMEQGKQALERSASSRGTLLTGGALKALTRFGQGLASSFDDKYYNRARGEYDLNRNIFESNQDRPFNKLASLAGLGQTASGQLGSLGSSYGANAGNAITGAGNAMAAGQIGSANAYSGAMNNAGQLPLMYYLLQQGQQNGGA